MKALDCALVCRASEGMDNWFVIERADHDGRTWMEFTGPHSASLMCSPRIGNADIEGPREHVVGIAKAILARERAGFKRCAAETTTDGVLLWSPRNSSEPTLVTHAAAKALAESILASQPTE